MRFFRKTPVAILLTLLIIALCCVIGYTRADSSGSQLVYTTPNQQAGESGLNYYLNWIDDGADLFSLETTDTLARQDLSLHSDYGCLVAIQTTNYLNGQDLETYTKDLFQQVELGSMDMLLVIETHSQDWYLAYGGTLSEYANSSAASPTLSQLFATHLGPSFFQGEADASILALFDQLETWCASALPAVEHDANGFSFFAGEAQSQGVTLGDVVKGILFTLLVNLWWIILLLVVLNVVDRIRFRRYITQHPPGSEPSPPFRPVLFWHHQNSNWFLRMMDLVSEDPDFWEDNSSQWNGGAGTGQTDGSRWTGGSAGSAQEGGSQEQQAHQEGAFGHDNAYHSGPYTGPGPDVGPQSAGFQPNSDSLLGLWRSCCRGGWSVFHLCQSQLRRFFRGRRM